MRQTTESFFDSSPLFKKHLAIKFMHFIANDGENNLTKAYDLLCLYPDYSNYLITCKQKLIDASGRKFSTEISAFQYAYWAGDIKMCQMMLNFLDEENKSGLLELCLNQDEDGLDYQVNEKIYQRVPHFDFKPLYQAYENYISFCSEVFEKKQIHDSKVWQALIQEFYKIGIEQTQIPIAHAQELCSEKEFKNIEEFKIYLMSLSPLEKTTTRIINPDTQTHDYWFRGGRFNSRLGQEFAIFKFRPIGANITRVCENKACHFSFAQLDLEAFKALFDQRFAVDRLALIETMRGEVNLHP